MNYQQMLVATYQTWLNDHNGEPQLRIDGVLGAKTLQAAQSLGLDTASHRTKISRGEYPPMHNVSVALLAPPPGMTAEAQKEMYRKYQDWLRFYGYDLRDTRKMDVDTKLAAYDLDRNIAQDLALIVSRKSLSNPGFRSVARMIRARGISKDIIASYQNFLNKQSPEISLNVDGVYGQRTALAVRKLSRDLYVDLPRMMQAVAEAKRKELVKKEAAAAQAKTEVLNTRTASLGAVSAPTVGRVSKQPNNKHYRLRTIKVPSYSSYPKGVPVLGVYPGLLKCADLAAAHFIRRNPGYSIEVQNHGGIRTREVQARLLSGGRSKTMNSKHLVGRALDLLIKDPKGNIMGYGSYTSDSHIAKYSELDQIMQAYAEPLGLKIFNLGVRRGWDYFHWQLENDFDTAWSINDVKGVA